MNRRGFIATITALAGVALARIKAPAAALRPGVTTLAPPTPITGLVQTSKDLFVFTDSSRYVYTQAPDGMWTWVNCNGQQIHPSDIQRAKLAPGFKPLDKP